MVKQNISGKQYTRTVSEREKERKREDVFCIKAYGNSFHESFFSGSQINKRMVMVMQNIAKNTTAPCVLCAWNRMTSKTNGLCVCIQWIHTLQIDFTTIWKYILNLDSTQIPKRDSMYVRLHLAWVWLEHIHKGPSIHFEIALAKLSSALRFVLLFAFSFFFRIHNIFFASKRTKKRSLISQFIFLALAVLSFIIGSLISFYLMT